MIKAGIFTFTDVDPDAIKETLAERLKIWKRQQQAKKAVEDDIQRLTPQIAVQEDQQRRIESARSQRAEEKILCVRCVEEMAKRRQDLFGTKNPEKEEEILKKYVEASRVALDSLKEELTGIKHQQENIENRIHELTRAVEERAKLLHIEEKLFSEQIHLGGFSDIDAYKCACLNNEERRLLEQLKSALERKKSELLAEKKAADNRFAELSCAPKTEESFAALYGQIQEASQRCDSVRETILTLKMILETNEKRREGAKAIETQIASQSKEAHTWRSLCSLIGAADGKKFRDFAQKMTLEMMIAHANRQLVKMSDRYLLRQSRSSPLELDVVDNYQASEERSVKNLSGGEAFIVSLSLALGLSQMSSSKVRVDTLFLDEGFGTLDERALEVALDTLSELHQEGKVIGLISHVTVLKERISTQIKVQPISGGRSRIDGPGCKNLL